MGPPALVLASIHPDAERNCPKTSIGAKLEPQKSTKQASTYKRVWDSVLCPAARQRYARGALRAGAGRL